MARFIEIKNLQNQAILLNVQNILQVYATKINGQEGTMIETSFEAEFEENVIRTFEKYHNFTQRLLIITNS